MLQPYIFALVCEYVVDGFHKGRNMIDMLPLDYLGLSTYDTKHSPKIRKMAKKHNAGKFLTPDEILSLQSSDAMIEFLVLIDAIETDGKKISLKEIKKRNKQWGIAVGDAGSVFQERIIQAKEQGDSLDTNMEIGNRKTLSLREADTMTPEEKILLRKRNALMKHLDVSFAALVKTYFWEDMGLRNGIYRRMDKQEFRAADYGIRGNEIFMNWNVDSIDRWLDFEKNPAQRRDIVETITHELTHLREWGKWGTHETGNHSRAFEHMQREMLGTYLRSGTKYA